MSEISVIGGGRWGTFLAWYAAKYCKIEKVRIYSHANSPEYKKMQATRKNAYLTFFFIHCTTPKNMHTLNYISVLEYFILLYKSR